MHDVVERGRLAEEPEEVRQHRRHVERETKDERQYPAKDATPPRTRREASRQEKTASALVFGGYGFWHKWFVLMGFWGAAA